MKKDFDRLILKNKDNLIGRHTYEDFEKLVRKIFKKYKVEVNIIPILQNVSLDLTTFGGAYDSEKDVIELDFFVTENSTNTILIPESFWSEFRFRLNQLMHHEQIHRQQSQARENLFESRKYKIEKDLSGEREYLADSDEIDAYSHDIALEIIEYYKNSEKTDIFSNISRKRYLDSFRIYKKAFKNTNWNIIFKKLVKKSYKWVDYYGF